MIIVTRRWAICKQVGAALVFWQTDLDESVHRLWAITHLEHRLGSTSEATSGWHKEDAEQHLICRLICYAFDFPSRTNKFHLADAEIDGMGASEF
ncbi:uncharacterized [Tachysurus ichikawai]